MTPAAKAVIGTAKLAAKAAGATKPAAKPAAATKPAAKPAAATKPAAKPAVATKPAAKPAVATKPAAKAAVATKPADKPAVATKAADKPAAPTKIVASAPVKPGAKPATPTKPAASLAKVSAPVPARFGFEAQALVRDAAALTSLLRAQLVWNARLSVGRVTTPDRIPASYFAVGLVRWRITEKGKPLFDIVQNTAFMAGTDEPAGLERRAGLWVATGRGAQRSLALDLIGVAWDLNRDWPGRRLPLPPEPKRGTKLKPEPLLDGEPFATDTAFV